METVTPYTADFDELRDVNHAEMQQGVLPELKKSNLEISGYVTSNLSVFENLDSREEITFSLTQ